MFNFDPVHVTIFLVLLSAVVGVYAGSRGVTGIKHDVAVVKEDIKAIKEKFSGKDTPPTPPTAMA